MWTGEIYFLAKGAGIPQFIILMTFAVHKTLSVAGALLAGLLLSSCSSTSQQVEAPARLPAYHFVPGKTAVLHNGKAIPPRNAPRQVKRAIAAANSLVNKPYRLGGGHRKHYDSHYDCSGSTSFVLKEAGLLTSTRHSKLFLNYGQKGAGDWISVYAKNGHVFMVICGLRFDTTGSGRRGEGPRWRVDGRNARNFLVRHPTGL